MKIYEWNYMPFLLRWMELQLLGNNINIQIPYCTCMGNTGKFYYVSSQSYCVIHSNNCLPYTVIKVFWSKYIFAFPRLTFMCQNKYLTAMRRNNYTVMHVDAAVHIYIWLSVHLYILLTEQKAQVLTVRYINQVIFSFVYAPHAPTARRARLQTKLNKSIIYITAQTRAFFEAHCS